MKKIFRNIAVLLVTATAFTSCLKDDTAVLDPEKGTNVIEFGNLAEIAVHGSTTPLYTISYEIKPTATNQNIVVSYSGPEASAPQDITVNIGLAGQAVIDQYNVEQGRSANSTTAPLYVPLPANMYSLTSTSIVIPKGQNKGYGTVALNTSLFAIGVPYVIPLKITSVSSGTISANFSNMLVNVVPKNKYDGIYSSVAGFIQRYTAPTTPSVGDALNGPMAGNPDVRMVTIGANTNQITGLNWGNAGGGVGGVDPILVTVDPTTNAVTVSSTTAPSMKVIAGKDNKYDPATKTYTLNFDWNQTANKREILGLVITFKGARP